MKLLIFLIIAVLSIWTAAPFLVSMVYSELSARGQFGDLYGSVNALFSGLAFAGLFYTIYLQTKQIRLQQSELKIQRQELRLQREEMTASRGELRKQVEMQHALLHATIAQIQVASVTIQTEAIKMESETFLPTGRQPYWIRIQEGAEAIMNTSKILESKIPQIKT
jgi:uncharacterized membrane protein YciS (DUF1049 family)